MKSIRLRWKMIGLVAVFVLPYAAAWLFYTKGASWRSVTSNRGQLIAPVLTLKQLYLKNASNGKLAVTQLHGKWSMLYMAPQGCHKACLANLYKIRQIRAVLHKQAARITLSLATPSPLSAKVKAEAQIALKYPGLQQFVVKPAPQLTAGVYLVDPAGNLFMRYQPDCRPTAIYEDLQHVLKVSRIG